MPGQAQRRAKNRPAEQETHYGVEQGLPSNVDAERAILGLVLLNPEAIHEIVAAGVQDVFFSLDSNRRVFLCMRDLAAESQPIDLITLADKLGKNREVEAVGGVAYLSSLTDGLPLYVSLDKYVSLLRETYQRRAVIFACSKTISMVMESAQDVTECIGGLGDELLGIKSDTITHPSRQIGEIAREAIAEIETQMYAAREIIGLPTGVNEFDLTTTGIREGEVVILGGYPGSGKTAFATQIGLDNARGGFPGHDPVGVEMFSLEMKQSAVAKRILSLYTDVSATAIRNPRHLHISDFRILEESVQYLDKIPMWVDDRCGQDVSEIIARARLAIRRKKVGLVIIDFLQLMTGPGETRNEQLTNGMKMIADTAKVTNVPFVVISQLTRPEGKDPNYRPTMFMLRDSGGIEQFAHLIGFTYRPVDDKRDPTGDDELIIGKQREGIVGSIPAEFDKRGLRWGDRKQAPAPPKEQQQTLGLVEGGKKTKSKKGVKQDGNGTDKNTGTENPSEGEGTGSQDS